MNAITKFRLCTLTDDELLNAVDAATDQMYQTGRIPDRQIPARPDADFDLIVGELICRFIEVKNALIEHRTKHFKSETSKKNRQQYFGEIRFQKPGFEIGDEIPIDFREQPINAEWYEPGMYFRNRYKNLIPSDTVEPGDEIENPDVDENSPNRWRPVTDQHIGIQARYFENRFRRQYFPKRSVNAV